MTTNLPASIARLLGDTAPEPDALGRSHAQVSRHGSVYLKTDKAGQLRRAALMQNYLHQKGLAGELLAYHTEAGRDYLVTEAAQGVCACSENWLARPERLAERLGQLARLLHDTPAADCPVIDANDRAISLWEEERQSPFPDDIAPLRRDTLIHGDFCLPNIFLTKTGVSFIDLGDGGLGDPHLDLCWGMWSLQYNLKTDRYNGRFLDAYGRERIDRERLRLAARLGYGSINSDSKGSI